MDKKILDYIKNNSKKLGQDDFDNFIESPEFNEMEDNSKRELFYINAFIMSTNNYNNNFKKIISDFLKIISFIDYYDYMHIIHESYETIICNYLDKIENLSRKEAHENENEFIECLNMLVDDIEKIYFPENSNKMKLNIAKSLGYIKIQLDRIKEEISKENLSKLERYKNNLNQYIIKLKDNDINESKNNKNKNIKKISSQNSEKNINNGSDIQNNNINKNINNDIISNSQNRNYYKKNNLNQINDNSYGNMKFSYPKNSNDINYDPKYFKIINNNSIRQDNMNNNINYYDSMVILDPNLNNNLGISQLDFNSDEDETEEEEKLQAKYEEVDNFIDEISPKYFLNNNQEKINNLKENLMIKEKENEESSLSSSQISQSSKSNLNAKKKKKKKKKSKKSNNQSQNLINNVNQNYNFMPNNNSNMAIPYPYQMQPPMIPNYFPQINGVNNGPSMNFIPHNNNFYLQNQYTLLPINNNFMAGNNHNYQIKNNKKKK